MNPFLPFFRFSLLACLLLLLGACATPPDAKVVTMPPVPEGGAENPESRPGLPPGLVLSHNGQALSLEDIENKSLPPDATITVTAARNVTYPAINDILKKIHEQGYLLEFRVAE